MMKQLTLSVEQYDLLKDILQAISDFKTCNLTAEDIGLEWDQIERGSDLLVMMNNEELCKDIPYDSLLFEDMFHAFKLRLIEQDISDQIHAFQLLKRAINGAISDQERKAKVLAKEAAKCKKDFAEIFPNKKNK